MSRTSDGYIWTHKTAEKCDENHLQNDTYFNSGILLINLKNIARNQQLLLDVKVPLKYPDQDILNVGLHKQIKPLALKYNFAPGVKISKNFTGRDRNADQDYKILHFYTAKPYYYQYVPHDMYTMFYKHCTALNFYPDEFVADEQKHFRKQKQPTRTNIPFLRIQNNTIRLFGIKIISF